MLVKIKRQDDINTKPYMQTINIDVDDSFNIIGLLNYINENEIKDVNGNVVKHISYSCSCGQKMCGACGIVVNNRPVLACATFIKNFKNSITIEPLDKFPVIKDLIVDKSIISDTLIKANVFIHNHTLPELKNRIQLYNVGKCLKCGLCLQACPNYKLGKNFFGPNFANDTYYVLHQSENTKELEKTYKEHFYKGCSKSLACVDVCPAHIDTLASISDLNSRI